MMRMRRAISNRPRHPGHHRRTAGGGVLHGATPFDQRMANRARTADTVRMADGELATVDVDALMRNAKVSMQYVHLLPASFQFP